MTKRCAQIVMLVVVFALMAFIVDVISPVTPTPTAQLIAKWCALALLFLPVFIALLLPLQDSAVCCVRHIANPTLRGGNSRTLIALICILLL